MLNGEHDPTTTEQFAPSTATATSNKRCRTHNDWQKRINWRRECSCSILPTRQKYPSKYTRYDLNKLSSVLADNPMVARFEWYDLLDKADERTRTGDDHSLAHAYVEAHATRPKQ